MMGTRNRMAALAGILVARGMHPAAVELGDGWLRLHGTVIGGKAREARRTGVRLTVNHSRASYEGEVASSVRTRVEEALALLDRLAAWQGAFDDRDRVPITPDGQPEE